MAGDTIITVIGNLTSDPEIRFTASGTAVASFTIASTPRSFDRASGQWKDGEALFMRCSAWREMAENVSETCTKGMRVIAQGRLQQRSFETQQGERRTVVEMQVDEIGPSLRYAKASVERNPRGDGAQGYGGNPGGAPAYNQGGMPGAGQGGYGGGNFGAPNQQVPPQNQGYPNQGGYGAGAPGVPGGEDPWGAPPVGGASSFDSEPPF